MSKIKIAFLFKCTSGWLGTGTYNHLYHWINGLSDDFELYFINCFRDQKIFLSYFANKRIKFIYLPALESKIFIYPAKKVADVLKKYQLDVLHTVGLHSDIIGALATFYYRPSLFISSAEGYLMGYQCPWYKQLVYRFLYKIVRNRLDVVTAISNQTAHELKNDFGVPAEKIKVLHSGVDLEHFEFKNGWPFQLPLAANAPSIGMIGRLSKEKGCDLFLDAAAFIKEKYPFARFFIAGDGIDKDKLKNQTKKLDIDKNVYFLGWLKNKIEFYKKIDILVVPAPRVYDGLPWVVLEGFATGTLIVATNGGGISDAVIPGKTGLLVDCNNPKLLADAVIWAWEHPEKAKFMVKNGREAIESHFNTKREVKGLKEIYLSCIKRNKTCT